MYEELFLRWASEQGFTIWSKDHAPILRNLAQWMEGQDIRPAVDKKQQHLEITISLK